MFAFSPSSFPAAAGLFGFTAGSTTNNDVVDGDVDEFDKESNEAHDGKSNCCCHGNLLEFFSIWLCASFDESDGVLDELPAGLHELHDLIHPEVMLC